MTAVPVPAGARSSVPGTHPTPYRTAAFAPVIPLHLVTPENLMTATYSKRTVDHHEWTVPGPAEPSAVAETMQLVENARAGQAGAGPVYLNGRDGAVIVGYAQDAPATGYAQPAATEQPA
ncbi:hypothetical protein ACEZCY_13995 [Streptacidiphilus sp. N1-12]|uniref:Uncharacterized protein n=2 Tax=Streptacidiphilus alkalitolerans TaxID=3342712 RepID=A0ABV6WE67_9ACTN